GPRWRSYRPRAARSGAPRAHRTPQACHPARRGPTIVRRSRPNARARRHRPGAYAGVQASADGADVDPGAGTCHLVRLELAFDVAVAHNASPNTRNVTSDLIDLCA